MGFDDSETDDELDAEQNLRRRFINNSNPSSNANNIENKLLDGLPLWLDRLFEGSTQRYYIGYWPEFPVYGGNERHHMHND